MNNNHTTVRLLLFVAYQANKLNKKSHQKVEVACHGLQEGRVHEGVCSDRPAMLLHVSKVVQEPGNQPTDRVGVSCSFTCSSLSVVVGGQSRGPFPSLAHQHIEFTQVFIKKRFQDSLIHWSIV